MSKFSVLDILNDNSKQKKDGNENNFIITMINIFDIQESKSNFYSTKEIDDLADTIEMLGVQQNLVLKELEDGKYEAIAGHRRILACKKLVNEGKDQFKTVPCIIETSRDSIREKLLLIFTNSTTRELSDYEKVEQAKQLKELLMEYKKEHKVPGRIRELVAETLNISTTQVARMDSISNNLSDELKKEFKEEKINISTAYEISGLEKNEQVEVYNKVKESSGSGDTFNISLKEIRERKQNMIQINSEGKDDSIETELEENLHVLGHDEQWFTKQLFDRFSDELKKLMRICRTSKSRAEVAKEFQKYASAYGARSNSGPGYSFNFHNFVGGIDIKLNGEEMHLKYGRLVEEALKLYNPFSSVFDEGITKIENDAPDIVNDKTENVNETAETIIEEPESVSESDKTCNDCKYNDMTPEEFKKLDSDGGMPCNCCDDDYSMFGPKQEKSEIMEADVKHTEPDSSDPEKYSIIEAQWEVKTHENNLDILRKDNCTIPTRYKTKMRLDAMLLLVTEMKKPAIEEESELILEQPELPVLKNNDQRREWLRKYQDWGIWYQDDNVNARYFKYDLSDGSRIVAAQYKNLRVRFHQEDGDWSLAHYHLIKTKDYFNPYESNQTEIVEHLKTVVPRK